MSTIFAYMHFSNIIMFKTKQNKMFKAMKKVKLNLKSLHGGVRYIWLTM